MVAPVKVDDNDSPVLMVSGGTNLEYQVLGDSWVLNLNLNKWQEVDQLKTSYLRLMSHACTLSNGIMLDTAGREPVGGALTSTVASFKLTRSADDADGPAGRWEKLTTLGHVPPPRTGAGVACLHNRLVLLGGQTQNGIDEHLFVFDYDKLTWTEVAAAGKPMKPRWLFSMLVPARPPCLHRTSDSFEEYHAFVVGGYSENADPLADVDVLRINMVTGDISYRGAAVQGLPFSPRARPKASWTTDGLVLFSGRGQGWVLAGDTWVMPDRPADPAKTHFSVSSQTLEAGDALEVVVDVKDVDGFHRWNGGDDVRVYYEELLEGVMQRVDIATTRLANGSWSAVANVHTPGQLHIGALVNEEEIQLDELKVAIKAGPASARHTSLGQHLNGSLVLQNYTRITLQPRDRFGNLLQTEDSVFLIFVDYLEKDGVEVNVSRKLDPVDGLQMQLAGDGYYYADLKLSVGIQRVSVVLESHSEMEHILGSPFTVRTTRLVSQPGGISKRLSHLFLGLEALLAMMVFAVGVVLLYFRKERSVYAVSPPFLFFSLAGCLVGVLCVVPISLVQEQRSALGCSLSLWSLNLACTTTFTPCFVKLYRLHRIFDNPMLMMVTIKVRNLMLVCAASIGLDVLMLLTWELLDPMQYVIIHSMGTLEMVCHREHQGLEVGFMCVLGISKLALVVLNLYLSFKTRRIPDVYNEARQITGVMMLVCTVSMLMVWLVVTDSQWTKRDSTIMYISSVLLCVLATLLGMFIPKLIRLAHDISAHNTREAPGDVSSSGEYSTVQLQEEDIPFKVPYLGQQLQQGVVALRRKQAGLHPLEEELVHKVDRLVKNDGKRISLTQQLNNLRSEAVSLLARVQLVNESLGYYRNVCQLDVSPIDEDLLIKRSSSSGSRLSARSTAYPARTSMKQAARHRHSEPV